MSLGENAEEYLAGLPMWASKKNLLSDIRRFLEEMGNPDEKMRLIHVAGTNGKGSVCAYLSSILGQAGYHTGVFTSPHLIDTRERFLFDGEMVPEKLYEESYQRIRQLSEVMMERGYCHPTYFEFLFLMGMDMFREKDPDFVILETGLGGRLDATNTVRHPMVSVITSISMDHMEYLGGTIGEIALEKAGIIKPGVPVVYDSNDETAAGVIAERAKEVGVASYPADKQGYVIHGYGENGIDAGLRRLNGEMLDVVIPSQADYQVMNGLLALRTAELLFADSSRDSNGMRLPERDLLAGITMMRWPGRMEETAPGIFLDGAHNTGGVAEFIKTAGRLCRSRKKRAFLLFSAVTDKEHQTMIREIVESLPLDGVVVAHIQSERGVAEDSLKKEFEAFLNCGVQGFSTVEEAYKKLLSWRDDSHLLFCVGSLYLMGEIKALTRSAVSERARRR